MKKSIFNKIFIGYSLITLFLVSTIVVFSFNPVKNFYIDTLRNSLYKEGTILNNKFKPIIALSQYDRLDQLAKEIGHKINTRITIIDTTGIVLADSENDPKLMENHLDRPEIQESMKTKSMGSSLRFSTTMQKEMLYVSVPIMSGQSICMYTRVSLFVSDINSLLNSLRQKIVLISFGVTVLSMFFASYLVRSFSKSIKKLAAVSRSVAEGDFDQKVLLKRDDELGMLADSFNYMISHIKALFNERMIAERALRESESTLRSFFNSSPMLMGIVELRNGDLLHITANTATSEYLDQPPDAIENSPLNKLGISSEAIESWTMYLRESMLTHKPVSFEHTHQWKNDQVSILYIIVCLITKSDSAPRFSYIIQDITEEKRMQEEIKTAHDKLEIRVKERTSELMEANSHLEMEIFKRRSTEEALRNSERKLRDIIENSPDSIMMVNRKGDILYAIKPPLDLELGDYINKNLFYILDVKTHRNLNTALDHVYSKNESFSSEIQIDEGNWWSFRYVPIVTEHDRTDILIIATNISQKKNHEIEKIKLEEQLFQAQKMESIGRLAGGIAHDFNNILAGIMGYADILRNRMKNCSAKDMNAIQTIHKSAKRAGELTQQLLGFARAGKYNPVPLDLNKCIQDVVEVSEKIFEKNINIHYDLESRLKKVEADETQMNQVFTNLIINAKDAMPDGGDIICKTENIFVEEEYSNKKPDLESGFYVKVSITDNGIGMSKETKKRIFDPFFTTKDTGKGTGLGLSMVYGIIKNHNGQVSCYSEVGEGTTFSLLIPASGEANIVGAVEESVVSGDATIMIVDDEEVVRSIISEQLTDLGYNVITAEDGKEAIDMYSELQENIDLVLLDMIMPNLAGKDTFKLLKEINPEIKVLLISGFSQNGKASQILKDGVKGFIQKPFTAHTLSKSIYDTLNN